LQQEAAVRGTLLAAAIHPDNTPHGYNWTFAFPALVFIIVAGILYLRFRGPHRVPGHVSLASSRWASAQPAAAVPTAPAQAVSSEPTVAATPSDDAGKTVSVDKGEPGPAATEQGESAGEDAEDGA
jgi:hypothetical protein